MSAMLLPATLLAALHVLWFLAFLADARADRHADPIGGILRSWLDEDPASARRSTPRRPSRQIMRRRRDRHDRA